MKQPHPISNELLQSFVDDELDTQERQYVLDAQVKNADVAREICELRKLKDLLKAARPVEEDISGSLNMPRQKYYLLNYRLVSMPAFVVLMSIIVAGVFFNQDKNHLVEYSSLTYPDVKTFIAAHSSNMGVNVVLHVNRDDEGSAKQLFDQLNQLLNTNKTKNSAFRVEVIASGPGLSLVRKNISPDPEKIRDIRKRYDNVVFVACQTTLSRLIKVINRNVELLPEVMLTASGPELIRLRKSQGWAYIKI